MTHHRLNQLTVRAVRNLQVLRAVAGLGCLRKLRGDMRYGLYVSYPCSFT